MDAPFALPARFDGRHMVAADCELICAVDALTETEREYITRAINEWPRAQRLNALLDELLQCVELNYDDPLEESTRNLINRVITEKNGY